MFLLDLLHLYLAPLPSWGGLLWLNQGPVTCLRTLQCMAVLCSLRWSHLPRGHVCHLAITSLSHRCARLSHGCARLSLVCHLAVTSLCTAATPLHPFVTLPSVSLSLHCSARRRRGSSGPYMPQVKTCVLLFGIQLNCVCVRECIFAH